MITRRSTRALEPSPTSDELGRALNKMEAYADGTSRYELADGSSACPACYQRAIVAQAVQLSVTSSTWQARRRWAANARADARLCAALEALAYCRCDILTKEATP